MTRTAMATAIALLAGCASTPCEKSGDIIAECFANPTPGSSTTGGGTEIPCDAGSVQECMSLCVIDAYDDGGCPFINDNTQTAPLLACQTDCAPTTATTQPTPTTP